MADKKPITKKSISKKQLDFPPKTTSKKSNTTKKKKASVKKNPITAVQPDLSIPTMPANKSADKSPASIIFGKLGFAKLYALAALIILFATTIFWSILGAKIQMGN